MYEFLKKKREQGGWRIDHPALVNKKHWIKLLNSML